MSKKYKLVVQTHNIKSSSSISSAIIIANGEQCSNELLENILGETNFIVVLDAAIDRVLALGIKPSVLLGDFDRGLNPSIYQQKHPEIEIIHSTNQHKTDLEKAFDFLLLKEVQSVKVVWATGRRSDHFFANISCIVNYRKTLDITIIDDYSKIILLKKKYENWYAAGTIISLIPLGKVIGISTKNLMYSLNNEELNSGYRMGNSNSVLRDGIVSIEHESGDLLLMECVD